MRDKPNKPVDILVPDKHVDILVPDKPDIMVPDKPDILVPGNSDILVPDKPDILVPSDKPDKKHNKKERTWSRKLAGSTCIELDGASC